MLNENDMNILRVLFEFKEGLQAYEIAEKVGRERVIVYYNLNKLRKLNFVQVIGIKSAIWRVNPNSKNNIGFVKVECWKCKLSQYVHTHQNTTSCKNSYCKTPKGERTRFKINPKRIVDNEVIFIF